MKTWIKRFFDWYERYYILNTGIAAGLFLLQLIHLYWLSADVVASRLVGHSYFELNGVWKTLILLVDYTEIPALITTSLLYIHTYRKNKDVKSILYLIFLNSQWLHIFWITDEFVVDQFLGNGAAITLPVWLAWVAIAIDYLELPVIYDTIKKLLQALKDRDAKELQEAFKE